MDDGFSTPLDTIGLSPGVIKILENNKVTSFGALCCITMDRLVSWGLSPSQIREILAATKKAAALNVISSIQT